MNPEVIGLVDTDETPALMGAGLLALVTTGLYDEPLSMYREYLQNAADAAAKSGTAREARVDIAIDVPNRRVRIRDNGPGLCPEDALDRLLPIGRSSKTLGVDRGIRGVGRLAGLAFAKTVTFTTRTCNNEPVTGVTWHSDRLPDITSSESDLEQAILDCVEVETLPGEDYPDHFFEVEVKDVARHSAGLLLNRDAVRDYIGEVCPVPISADFPFALEVQELFSGEEAPLVMEVWLEGDQDPVERPHGKAVCFSANKMAEFTDFQPVRIPSTDGDGDMAVGWVAHSSYLGAIPKEQRIRGIRARAGNIQVGGEAVFEHLYKEERFNRWCVGELHILESQVIPNARRDYFQPGFHLRHLENHLTPILREISARCRRESTIRNSDRKALSALSNIENLHSLAASGYLSEEDSVGLVQQALQEVQDVRKSILKGNLNGDSLERLDSAEELLMNFSGKAGLHRFESMNPSEAIVYRKVFAALATLAPSPETAMELIELVFAEASRVEGTGSGLKPDQRNGNHSQGRLALDDAGVLTPR